MKRGDWLAIANLLSAFICAVAFWKLRGVPALITLFGCVVNVVAAVLHLRIFSRGPV